MNLLSYEELLELLETGVILNSDPKYVNGSSIDITLGANVLVEEAHGEPHGKVVSLKAREGLSMYRVSLDVMNLRLSPGQFCLAQSNEIFNLPLWLSAEFKLKSSIARMGLEHLNAGWCDAGWHGSCLTMELKNMTQFHTLQLEKNLAVGQMIFYRHAPVPAGKDYGSIGRYNGDVTVTQAKR